MAAIFLRPQCIEIGMSSSATITNILNLDLIWGCGLAFIPACISIHVSSNVWDEITYPFPNLNSFTTEVLEWMSNFIQHLIMDKITN